MEKINRFIDIYSPLLNFLFPIRCLGCGEKKTYCCEKCFLKIPRFQEVPMETQLIAAAPFVEKSFLSKLIHHFKYDGIRDIGPRLIELLPPPPFPPKSALVPVPLHWRRENIRGFNQSVILAHALAKKSKCAVLDFLKRHRFTQPQIELPRQKRLTNLRGAFSLKNPLQKLDPAISYFLVDDVSTTGATFTECATVLKNHGAKNIRGIVIARTL
jgi:ComF family protein